MRKIVFILLFSFSLAAFSNSNCPFNETMSYEQLPDKFVEAAVNKTHFNDGDVPYSIDFGNIHYTKSSCGGYEGDLGSRPRPDELQAYFRPGPSEAYFFSEPNARKAVLTLWNSLPRETKQAPLSANLMKYEGTLTFSHYDSDSKSCHYLYKFKVKWHGTAFEILTEEGGTMTADFKVILTDKT